MCLILPTGMLSHFYLFRILRQNNYLYTLGEQELNQIETPAYRRLYLLWVRILRKREFLIMLHGRDTPFEYSE